MKKVCFSRIPINPRISQNWFCEHLQETQEPPVFDEKNIEKNPQFLQRPWENANEIGQAGPSLSAGFKGPSFTGERPRFQNPSACKTL